MDNMPLDVTSSKGLGGLLKSVLFNKKENYSLQKPDELNIILEAVKGAEQDLEMIEGLFDTTSDPDLIEYAIYQEYAVKLKLSYLVKKAKEKNIRCINYTAL